MINRYSSTKTETASESGLDPTAEEIGVVGKRYRNEPTYVNVERSSHLATSSFGYVLEASGTENRRLMEAIFTWAREVGQGLGELPLERRKEFLQMVVEDVVIDGNSNVDVTLAIPIESKPTTEVSVQTLEPSH